MSHPLGEHYRLPLFFLPVFAFWEPPSVALCLKPEAAAGLFAWEVTE
eukprot:gene12522-10754_t